MIGKTFGVKFTEGLQYGIHRQTKLVGDLYVPDAPGPHPAIICAHGGGWDNGSRVAYSEWGSYLAERGYALFTADRRHFRADEPAYPGAINDLQAAVRYVRYNAPEYLIDPKRIALMGDSSGGYVAALAGLVGDAE